MARQKSLYKSVFKTVYEDPPRKQVLLLSCMDQRLLDNIVAFMNQLNLHNRYDQVIFAGAAMGVRNVTSTPDPRGPALPWKAVFFDHLTTAIDKLHRDIKDIFLLEHLDCGAYKELHPDPDVKEAYRQESDVPKLERFHRVEAQRFAREVEAFCRGKQKGPNGDAWKGIRVRCLIMDLLGHVKDM